MRLLRVTLVPIECFEVKIRERIEHALLENKVVVKGYEGSLRKTFLELVDDVPELYHTARSSGQLIIAFHGSSLCLARFTVIDNWAPSISSITSELIRRRHLHSEIVKFEGRKIFGVFIPDVQNEKRRFKRQFGKYYIRPNYAFTFYIVDSSGHTSAEMELLIKILAEPSAVNIDDMMSSQEADYPTQDANLLNLETLSRIENCDIIAGSSVYITWASLCAIIRNNPSSLSRTTDVIATLEIRLQMVWNKCYALSNYADAIFSHRTYNPAFAEYYWEIIRAFDDAKGVLASTTSTRANVLYDEMLRTSRLSGELSRLESKVNMCDRFVSSENLRKDSRYRRIIEILLFMTAISQLMPVLFALPFAYFKDNPFTAASVISVLFLVGAVTILFRR